MVTATQTDPGPAAAIARPWNRAGNMALWPVALFLFIHRVFILAVNGDVTDDFTTVYSALRRFLEGTPVYNEEYGFVDPHYLYNPGATLLLSPLALSSDFFLTRLGFILMNALAIILGLAILTRLFGYPLHSMVWPASMVIAFMTEAVQNTLIFANINGLLFAGFCYYLYALHHGQRLRAGVAIGVAILIKPIFAPVLFVPLVLRYWRTLLAAIVIPVGVNLIAWPFVPQATDYITRTTPYLKQVRDYSNSSLRGMALYFGMPTWLTVLVWIFFAAVIILGLLALLQLREHQRLIWIVSTCGLLLSGVFLLSSLGQMYYSMMLFPLAFSVVHAQSLVRHFFTWVGLYLCLSADSWQSLRWLDYGRWMSFFQATAGWSLIILTLSTAAVVTAWPLRMRTILHGRKDLDNHDRLQVTQ